MGYDISAGELTVLHQEKGLQVYEDWGGVAGLTKRLRANLAKGVASSEILERREVFGENRIPAKPPRSYCSFILECLEDNIIRMLCACALAEIINAIIDGVQQGMVAETVSSIFEGASILGTVVLDCLLQATQGYMKERSFRKLNAEVSNVMINVVRDGQQIEVLRYDIVVGDVVVVSVGDVLEADGVLINGEAVECDESAMTGEPEDIKKDPVNAPFLFAGTAVKNGSGHYLVTAVGVNTMSGRITALIRGQKVNGPSSSKVATTDEPNEDGAAEKAAKAAKAEDDKEEESAESGSGSVLRAKLEAMAHNIAHFAIAISVFVALVRLLIFWSINYGVQKKGWSSNDITIMIKCVFTGIALAVVAIPEGLPLAVTLSLSLSIKNMQRDNNLVKHLDATETMGSATTICSDKTGTLTQNRMTVMRVFIGGKEYVGEQAKDRTCGAVMKREGDLSADFAEKLLQSICLTKTDGTDIRWDTEADRWEQKGNKTDCALLALANDMGADYRDMRSNPLYNTVDVATGAKSFGLKSYPFSSSRKRSGQAVSCTMAKSDGPCRLYVKGASEMILKLATQQMMPDGSIVPLTESDRERISFEAIDKFASQAMRTIGLAFRDFITPPSWDEELDKEEARKLTGQVSKTYKAEIGLTLLGICGINDPVREGVPHAITQCNTAGVDVRMVTGDHVATAIAIAKDCGILRRGIDYKDAPGEPLAHKFTAMTGEDFRSYVLDSQRNIVQSKFDEVWPYLRVLARSSPEDKYVLVSGLCDSNLYATPEGKRLPIHQDQQVVAVTGDGTNDAPALRRAHVGFAMKITGTRVAQDAADILLLDDNFASVVKACLWGRNVYDSIAKFLQFQLTVNISAVVITLVGAFTFSTQPLSVVQMIWVNLIMDSLGALTFASEEPRDELLQRPPYGRNRRLLTFEMRANMIGQACYQLVALLVILFASAGRPCGMLEQPCHDFPRGGFFNLESGLGRQGSVITQHLTLLFNAFVFMQLFNWINCRKLYHEWNVFSGLGSNSVTFVSTWLIVLVIQILFIVTPIGRVVQAEPIGGGEWALCVLLGVGSLLWQWVIILACRGLRRAPWCREAAVPAEPAGEHASVHVGVTAKAAWGST